VFFCRDPAAGGTNHGRPHLLRGRRRHRELLETELKVARDDLPHVYSEAIDVEAIACHKRGTKKQQFF
jgi:hypothetical protein